MKLVDFIAEISRLNKESVVQTNGISIEFSIDQPCRVNFSISIIAGDEKTFNAAAALAKDMVLRG